MKLSSNTLMSSFSKKACNLLSLFFVSKTWQASIPVALTLVSAMTIVPAEIARADGTFSPTVSEGFGCNNYDFSSSYPCKIMVTTRNGKQFFIWYSASLGVPVGSRVIVTYYDYETSWTLLTNPANGNQANIGKVMRFTP